MTGENTPNLAYLTYHQQATNSLHPSCNPTSPMEIELVDSLENEEISVVRGRGPQDRDRAERERRRDRERERRGLHREERRDRHRRERDQERGDDRRQRDRGDRTYRSRYNNPKPNPRRN